MACRDPRQVRDGHCAQPAVPGRGAVLTFASDIRVEGIDMDTVGVILMVVCAVGLLWVLVTNVSATRDRRSEAVVVDHRD
jgi:hypothetical protein